MNQNAKYLLLFMVLVNALFLAALYKGSDVVFIGFVVVMGVLGAVLHELTHWVGARLHGLSAEIDWLELECYWVLHEEDWVNRRIAIAPLVFGGVVFYLWLVVFVSKGLYWSFPGFVGWVVYTFGGVRNDIAQYNEFEGGVKV